MRHSILFSLFSSSIVVVDASLPPSACISLFLSLLTCADHDCQSGAQLLVVYAERCETRCALTIPDTSYVAQTPAESPIASAREIAYVCVCTAIIFEFNERSNWPERNAISVSLLRSSSQLNACLASLSHHDYQFCMLPCVAVWIGISAFLLLFFAVVSRRTRINNENRVLLHRCRTHVVQTAQVAR